MNKKTINKISVLLLAVVMCFGMMPIKVSAASFNNSVTNIQLYDSGCLKSMDVTIVPIGSYRSAYGRIAIHSGATSYSWDNKPFTNGNSWPTDATIQAKDSTFMLFGGGAEFDWTEGSHTVTISFADNKVDLGSSQNLYIMLWTRSTEYGVYPDATITTLNILDGKLMDSSGNTLADKNIVTSHSHEYTSVWSTDDTYHWHVCTADGCDGTQDAYEEHIYGSDTDKTCNTCGYVRTLTAGEPSVPAAPIAKPSDAKTEVEVADGSIIGAVGGIESVYQTFSTDDNKGYTKEDEEFVNDGGSVLITLKADIVNGTSEEKKAVEEQIIKDGYTVGSFVDLSVLKELIKAGEVTPYKTTNLIELPYVIEVEIEIPEEQRNMENYRIYRYHEGSVDVITTTVNEDGEYVELSADGTKIILSIKKFSEYAIGYSVPHSATNGTPVNPDNNTTEAKKDDVPKTGENTPIAWLYVLTIASGSTLVYLQKRKKQSGK